MLCNEKFSMTALKETVVCSSFGEGMWNCKDIVVGEAELPARLNEEAWQVSCVRVKALIGN